MRFSVVDVHYTGRLDNGDVFDTSIPRGEPFRFTLGAGQVIPGWEMGILGMKAGGKRVLSIPPELAYGQRGAGNVIPPNASLTFEARGAATLVTLVHRGLATLPPDHAVRHGKPVAAFIRGMGMMWGDNLRSLRALPGA